MPALLEARQLHLQLALVGLRALREDFQDHLGAIEHAQLQFLFDVSLLRRRQLVVEHDERGVELGRGARHLRHLAAAGIELGIGAAAPAAQHAVALHPRALHQSHHFLDALLKIGLAEIQADDDGRLRIGGLGEGFRLPCGQTTPVPSPPRG